MAYAAKYRVEFTSDQGTDWKIDIVQDGFGGGVTTFKGLDSSGFRLRYEGENSTRYKQIIGSHVTVPIYVGDASQQAALTDMASAQEEEYKIEIYKDAVIYWRGVILTDQITVEDQSYPYLANIRAVDGLGRLKEIDYNNDGTAYPGKDNLIEHLFKIIGHTGITDLYGSSDDILKTIVNWYEDSGTTYVNTLDPLGETYFLHSNYITEQEDGTKEYASVHKVLSDICTVLGARFFYANGLFYLMQVDDYRNSTHFARTYQQDGTQSGTETALDFKKTIGSGGISKLAGGKFEYLQPLQSVKVCYDHRSNGNLLQGITWTEADTTTQNLGTVDNSGGAATFHYSGLLHLVGTLDGVILDADVDGDLIHYHVFGLKVQIGSYYLTTDSAGATIWTTTDSYYEVRSNFFFFQESYDQSKPIEFTTPPLPETGTLQVRFYRVETRKADGTVVAIGALTDTDINGNTVNLSLTYDLTKNWLEYLADGETSSQDDLRCYEVTNETGGALVDSSYQLDLGTVKIFDGINAMSPGRLQISTDDITFSDSSQWQVDGAGTKYGLPELMLRTVMGGQMVSIRTILGQIRGDFEFYNSFAYDGTKHIFMGGSFTAGSDIWNVELFEFRSDTNNIGALTTEIFTTTPGPPSSGPTSTNGGGGNDDIGNSNKVAGLTQLTTGIKKGNFYERLSVNAIGTDVLNEGDQVTVIHSITGETQHFTLERQQEAADTFLEVNAIATHEFPTGSVINQRSRIRDNKLFKDADRFRGLFEEDTTINEEGISVKYEVVVEDAELVTADDLDTSGVVGLAIDSGGIKYYRSGDTTTPLTIINASTGVSQWPGAMTIYNGDLRVDNGDITASGNIDELVPDYVFSSTYELPKLEKVQKFVQKNQHLPEIPNEAEVKEKGIKLGAFAMQLLKKIEEVYLYLFDIDRRLKNLEDGPKD